MAPIFGQSPKEFLAGRLAAFQEMTPKEFASLRSLDALWDKRSYEHLMADLGIKPGMSKTQKRRALQPEFDYAWGKVNPESFINTYGKSVYNEMRRQFGPGFFARKGRGFGMDDLAANFHYEERGGYHATAFGHDEASFAERVMMPHDAVEMDLRQSAGAGAYFQAAMSKSDAGNVREFVDSVRASGGRGKEFYNLGPVSVGGRKLPAEINTDTVRHTKNRHPDFSEWDRITEVVENGRRIPIGRDNHTRAPAYAHILEEGNSSLVVFGAEVEGSKKPHGAKPSRLVVLTAFRDSTAMVRDWATRYDSAASFPRAEQAAPVVGLDGGVSSARINSLEAEVNALLRGKGKAFEQTPRGGIRQLDDGRYIVGLFRNRDASTVIHETGHFFLENLREAAGLETAPKWVKDSWAALQKEYGFDGMPQGEAWRAAQERFALSCQSVPYFTVCVKFGKLFSHDAVRV